MLILKLKIVIIMEKKDDPKVVKQPTKESVEKSRKFAELNSLRITTKTEV